MSEKHDLAVLFSLLDRPIAEFVESEPFKKLEQETDVIRHIEPFGLPEIKRLICCSDLLAVQEWAEKYAEARKLYASGVDFDVRSLLMQYKDATDFEKKILACVDESILGRINAFFKKITTEKEQAKKERSSLKGKITKAKKKLAEETSQEASAKESNTAVNDGSEVAAGDNATLEMAAPETKSDDEIRVEKLNSSAAPPAGMPAGSAVSRTTEFHDYPQAYALVNGGAQPGGDCFASAKKEEFS